MTSNNFCEDEKMRLTAVAASQFLVLCLPLPAGREDYLGEFTNVLMVFLGLELLPFHFWIPPPETVTGDSMLTNNFLVALLDFAQTLPSYSDSWIWKVLLFSSSKLNWLRKQVKVRGFYNILDW